MVKHVVRSAPPTNAALKQLNPTTRPRFSYTPQRMSWSNAAFLCAVVTMIAVAVKSNPDGAVANSYLGEEEPPAPLPNWQRKMNEGRMIDGRPRGSASPE